MKDLLSTLDGLKRPRLLIRAARLGVVDYRREVHLRRHFGYGPLPRNGHALFELIEMESMINERRKAHDAGYSPALHVDILIAMMGEARLLRASYPV